MATTLNLRNTLGSGIGNFRDVSTSVGSSNVTAIVNTVASGTSIQWTHTAGGTAAEWISGRSPAGGWTLSGSVSVRLWALESNTAANAGGQIRLYKRTPGGTETELGGSPWNDGVEFGTTNALMTWSFTPTSMSFAEDDRLVIRFFITNVGVMGGARTCTMRYNNSAANSGDTSITLTETVAFKVEERTGTLSASQAENTIVAFGTTIDHAANWKTAAEGLGATVTAGALAIVEEFIDGGKADGWFYKINSFFPFAMNDPIAMYVDLVNGVNATPVGSPTVDPQVGVGPLNGTSQYIDLNTTGGFSASTNSGFGFDLLNNKAAGESMEMGSSDSANPFSLNLSVKWSDDNTYAACNDSNAWNGATAASNVTGVWSMTRGGATAPMYQDGVLFIETDNGTTSPVPDFDVIVGAANNVEGVVQNFSTGKFGMAYTSDFMSATDVANMVSRWNTFKTDMAALSEEGATGTLSVSQAGDTLAGTANLIAKGTLAATQAGDTVAGVADLIVKGTLSAAQAAHTLVGVGGAPQLTGTLNVSQGGDTLSASGDLIAQGAATASQADNTLSATGRVLVRATATAAQADHTLAASAKALIQGTVAASQAGNTLAASADLLAKGQSSLVQDAHTLSGTAKALVVGALTVQQAGDTLFASSQQVATGSLTATQAANTIAATGTTPKFGSLNVSQADQALVASGEVRITGGATALQEPDGITAFAEVLIEGVFTVGQEDQALAALAGVIVSGSLTVTQDDDTLLAEGDNATSVSEPRGADLEGTALRGTDLDAVALRLAVLDAVALRGADLDAVAARGADLDARKFTLGSLDAVARRASNSE